MLGKETIDTRTRGITRGSHGSSNTNYQNAGRELLTLDEVRLLDNSNALVFIRGEKPIMDKKFNILSHPNVKLTADGGAVPYTHIKDSKYLRKNIKSNITIPEGDLTIDENLIKNSGITFVDLPVTETQAEEPKVEKQPLKKRIKDYLLNVLKQIKSKLWRLLRNEKK